MATIHPVISKYSSLCFADVIFNPALQAVCLALLLHVVGGQALGFCEAPGAHQDCDRCYYSAVKEENGRVQKRVSYCEFAEVLISLNAACSQFLTPVSLSGTG